MGVLRLPTRFACEPGPVANRQLRSRNILRPEYAELGDGPPLLVVHGAGGGFDQGIELGRSLAKRGFRVIAMSRFGYLRTPLPADPSPAPQADAHASLMDALEIPRAAIFGGSAGAPSAMQFAIRHPDRCAALILLVPMAYKDPDVGHSAPKLSPLAEKILMTIVGSDLAFWLASKLARDMVIERVLATPPELVKTASRDEQARVSRVLEMIEPISGRARGLVNDVRISASLSRYELEKIRAPTLVLSVRDDLYGTFARAEYTAKEIPGARFVGYDVGGHVWVGHHEQMIAEVAAFLKP
jgi:2-hydroxy-6-oxonona-2,4-dienedioate hydrolase